MQPKWAAVDLLSKDPSNMTRTEKLRVIAYLFRTHGMVEAQKFWLRECPRVSKAAFKESLSMNNQPRHSVGYGQSYKAINKDIKSIVRSEK